MSSPTLTGGPRLMWGRGMALSVFLIVGVVLTLLALRPTPSANALGLYPGTEALLASSGITLQLPVGTASVSRRRALALAEKQSGGEPVDKVFLATAVGVPGSDLPSPGTLCWVVFLAGLPNQYGQLTPGTVELDAVLIDAHSGRFLRGFIAFSPSTAGSGVGSE